LEGNEKQSQINNSTKIEQVHPISESKIPVEDIMIMQEDTASCIAKIIIYTFATMIIISLFLSIYDNLFNKVMGYLNIVLPTITTLVGMILGFYFSEKRITKFTDNK